MTYESGTKVLCNDIVGTVIRNFKLSGDICIEWEGGMRSSYDVEWLDENVVVMQ